MKQKNKLNRIVLKERQYWIDHYALLQERANYRIAASMFDYKQAELNIAKLTKLSESLLKNVMTYGDYLYLKAIATHYQKELKSSTFCNIIGDIDAHLNQLLHENAKTIIEYEDMDDMKEGDFVCDDIVHHFLSVLSSVQSQDLVQISQAYDMINGKATFQTLWRHTDGWVYIGDCHFMDGTKAFEFAPIPKVRTIEDRIFDAVYANCDTQSIESVHIANIPDAEYVLKTKEQPDSYIRLVGGEYDEDNMCEYQVVELLEAGEWTFKNYLPRL